MKFIICSLLTFCAGASFAAQGNYNFRLSPVAFGIGGFDTQLDIRVGDKVTIGPRIYFLNYERFGGATHKLSQVGVDSTYAFNGTFEDGYFFSGGLRAYKAEYQKTFLGVEEKGDGTGVQYNLKAGYAWFWQAFNTSLGLTASRSAPADFKATKDVAGTTTYRTTEDPVAIDWRVGWVF